MSKTLVEAQVTTAKARSRLEPGAHWRRLDAESHLGYRKGKHSGVWFVRWRNHYEGGNYKQAPLGVANDLNDKPADGALTFEQAMKAAREAVARARTEAAAHAAGPAPTVRTAVEAYIPEVIPYALRHSSIVRGLSKGLPIQQVAKLHNTSVKMIERHYAKYIATALEELARAAVVPLVPRGGGNVVPMGKRA
jgi:hypothetical protein